MRRVFSSTPWITLGAALVLCVASITARAEINIGISIGINVPVYPHLVVVPGYPVYYDPDIDANYFFYDGQYWVYSDDNWYSSSWYNGPWALVEPYYVPAFVLRVPVRYYRRPPVYFAGWARNAPPRWGEHWGHSWELRRVGWNKWDRRSAPRPAPLPVYQRQYSGERYPREIAQQREIRSQKYRYTPRDSAVRRVEQTNRAPSVPRAANSPQLKREQQERARPTPQREQAAPGREGPSPSQAPRVKPNEREQARPAPQASRGNEGNRGGERGGDRGGEGKGRNKDRDERGNGRD